MFWVDFTNDNINRASGIETPASTFTSLVTTGIGCAGKYNSICVLIGSYIKDQLMKGWEVKIIHTWL